VAAHGTGVSLPTVEEMIVTMKMATPTEGLMTLSETANPRLFGMAKVGLGALGVVTELTMKCIPCLELLEVTQVCDRNADHLSVSAHVERLRNFRHVRYMWVPYTDTVVTVVSNPVSTATTTTPSTPLATPNKDVTTVIDKKDVLATKPLSDLLLSLCPDLDPLHTSLLSFSVLRDQLLDIAPLDLNHIKMVNKAEALFWRASEGIRQGDSTDILGFDCGGEQLVMEFCFPIGTLHEGGQTGVTDGKDLLFVQKLLTLVEKAGIPAASPVEQVQIYTYVCR
jgi:L-galactono-1,4-lactone dehydrogenase